jgi:hypothetical protein
LAVWLDHAQRSLRGVIAACSLQSSCDCGHMRARIRKLGPAGRRPRCLGRECRTMGPKQQRRTPRLTALSARKVRGLLRGQVLVAIADQARISVRQARPTADPNWTTGRLRKTPGASEVWCEEPQVQLRQPRIRITRPSAQRVSGFRLLYIVKPADVRRKRLLYSATPSIEIFQEHAEIS